MNEITPRGSAYHGDAVQLDLPVLEAGEEATITVPDNFLVSMFHGRWVHVGDLPAVSVFETPFFGVGGWIKRTEDLVLGSLFTAIAALPMLCIALVRLESPGRSSSSSAATDSTARSSDLEVPRDGGSAGRRGRATGSAFDPGYAHWRHLRRTSLDELRSCSTCRRVDVDRRSAATPRPQQFYVCHPLHGAPQSAPGITAGPRPTPGAARLTARQDARGSIRPDIRNWSVPLDLKILPSPCCVWRSDDAY